MPKGTCDPGPGAFNEETLSKGGMTVTVRSGWDGVSAWPNCAGPIHDVRLLNESDQAWIVQVPNSRAVTEIEAAPGSDRTITGEELAAVGLVEVADVADLTLIQV